MYVCFIFFENSQNFVLSLHAILAIDFSDINGEVEKTIRVPLQYTIMTYE